MRLCPSRDGARKYAVTLYQTITTALNPYYEQCYAPQGLGMLFLMVTIVTHSVTIVTLLAMIERNPPELTLRLLLKRADKKQVELAEKTGLSRDAIRAYVAGRRMPSFDNAALLARELGVSFKTLAVSLGIDIEDIPDDEPPTD